MKLFSYILLSLLLVVSLFQITGCAGQGQTAAEARRQRIRTYDADIKALHDDLEAFMLVDRPSRLTDKVVR